MSKETDAEIDATVARIVEHAKAAAGTDDLDGLDELQIKELQLQGLQHAEQVIANDQKASIMSVVVFVATT